MNARWTSIIVSDQLKFIEDSIGYNNISGDVDLGLLGYTSFKNCSVQ